MAQAWGSKDTPRRSQFFLSACGPGAPAVRPSPAKPSPAPVCSFSYLAMGMILTHELSQVRLMQHPGQSFALTCRKQKEGIEESHRLQGWEVGNFS